MHGVDANGIVGGTTVSLLQEIVLLRSQGGLLLHLPFPHIPSFLTLDKSLLLDTILFKEGSRREATETRMCRECPRMWPVLAPTSEKVDNKADGASKPMRVMTSSTGIV